MQSRLIRAVGVLRPELAKLNVVYAAMDLEPESFQVGN